MEQTDSLQQAIETARSGNITLASRLLARYVTVDPRNVTAWIWLAACLDDPDKRDYCLKKAHEINPDSPATAEELEEYLSHEISQNAPSAAADTGQPIELPAPEVPVVPVEKPVEVVSPSPSKGMSRNQVTVLVLLVVAILIVLAVLGYSVLTDPNLLSSLLGR